MENNRHVVLMNDRDLIKYLNKINNRKFSYMNMLLDSPDFYYDIMDVYYKHMNNRVDKTYVKNIISVPNEWETNYFVEFNDNKITKISPFIRVFNVVGKLNTENDIIKNFISDFEQVIEKYRKLGPEFKIKCVESTPSIMSYYLYSEVENI